VKLPASKMRMIAGCLLAVGISLAAAVHAQTPVHTPAPGMTCAGDRLVWVNTRSGVYHFRGERYFGSTQQGKFICEHDALREGDRPTRNGQ
jgi:hypothetical protein